MPEIIGMLSGAAGILSIIQLIESLDTIISKLQDAPDFIIRLQQELQTLKAVLDESSKQIGPDQAASFEIALFKEQSTGREQH